MKSRNLYLSIFALFLFFAIPLSSSAYDLPSVNLGFTSFMDGAPPSGPGLYSQDYVQYWTADEFMDQKGDPLLPPFAGEELEAWITLIQCTYQSNTEFILTAKWGLDVIVPFVKLDMSYDNYLPGLPLENSGMGDIWVGPYLQWDPIMGENGPRLLHRFSLGFILPTGDYEETKAINAGSNFFSFNPYWAATYFITPKWTASTRVSFLWNDENDEPYAPLAATGVEEVQAGEAFHINFATSYELIPQRLRAGINGYYLRQVSETEYDGVDQVGSKEKVMAIGPGMLYSFNKDAHLFINMYFETEAENRPEGERINARFVYHF
jgi:anthranilate 1,2-dioxygenase (deaminating, decarboxylating) large subunit